MTFPIGDSGAQYSAEYLKDIKNDAFTRIDGAGNKDGKVTVDEAIKDLDIGGLLVGQNEKDAAKIKAASANISETLAKYAGEDGEFTPEEWANFLNGSEWGQVLDAYHSSDAKAKLEMSWIDKANSPDNQVTKGEVKVGLFNSLVDNGYEISADVLNNLVDKYCGEDGVFTLEQYQALKRDPEYIKLTMEQGASPWFNLKM